ncbi:hypothetical protein [Methanobrevibacter arboriphilus]|uniref:Uncharacterized protein n=1 Tax=Methanobrevibacter arboriphilus TaxID=39441 RepID=A0ACA8R5Y5_METAZ|nr:hypothetical protein [Methanobrevibacter arboriphilus]BBL62370.1 hypothetical protein MarbSA_14100 [Methanobrevibacter arboriphilus]
MVLIDTEENIILEETSTVTKHNNTNSKRTVIPQRIANNMGINAKDKILWKMVMKNDEKYYIVKPVD